MLDTESQGDQGKRSLPTQDGTPSESQNHGPSWIGRSSIPFRESTVALTWDWKIVFLKNTMGRRLQFRGPWCLADKLFKCPWAHWVNHFLSESRSTWWCFSQSQKIEKSHQLVLVYSASPLQSRGSTAWGRPPGMRSWFQPVRWKSLPQLIGEFQGNHDQASCPSDYRTREWYHKIILKEMELGCLEQIRKPEYTAFQNSNNPD